MLELYRLSFYLLLLLVGSTLIPPWVSWTSLIDYRLILAAAALFWSFAQIPRSDERLFRTSCVYIFIGFALPAIWVLIQLLPLPFLANPVWDSAKSALGPNLRGHISADLPSTWQALSRIILVCATMTLSGVVALDRELAEKSLLALTALATFRCITLAILGSCEAECAFSHSIIACTALMAILSACACILLGYERYETRRSRQSQALARFIVILVLGGASVLICGGVLLFIKDAASLLALVSGLSVFAGLVSIRRMGLGVYGILTLALLFVVSAACLTLTGGPIFKSLSTSTTGLMEQTRLMIHDAPLAGTGAGTFPLIYNLYKSIADPAAYVAPSLLAGWLIELGSPAVGVLCAEAGVLCFLFIRGGLTRGRDSPYPILGAAVTAALVSTMVLGSGLADPSTGMLAGAILGLTLVQRLSRSKARAT